MDVVLIHAEIRDNLRYYKLETRATKQAQTKTAPYTFQQVNV